MKPKRTGVTLTGSNRESTRIDAKKLKTRRDQSSEKTSAAKQKLEKRDKPVVAFKSAQEWEDWLANNYPSDGIWLRFFKKASGRASVNYDEALDVALCYGWIDGQLKRYDEHSYLQSFTPRRPKSLWSKRNVGHVERLIQAGRMRPPGLAAMNAAKADGRWDAAYDSASKMRVPPDFVRMLSTNPKADAFFKTLDKANTYAILWRLQTAGTPEKRAQRMQTLIEMLNKGQKVH